MKMRRIFPALLMLLLATTIVTTQSSSATAPDNSSSAFGQGSFNFLSPREVPRLEQWDFSFDVTANKKGHARGRAIFDISTAFTEQTQVVVKIDCMNVRGPSGFATATMTGTVLHSDDPHYPKGVKVVFAAADGSSSDIITPIFIIDGFAGDCHDIGQPLTMFELSPDAITIEP